MTVFELMAKINLDKSGFDRGLEAAKKGFGTIAKVGTTTVAAAGAAAGAIVKQSVDQFGQYEQLVGGIQTLFGQSADKVLASADNAFKTAGMSANQYMETSIQSAAALINSLDGDQAKAAELMDMSITDMADNVNKMGTTMDAVQNAYRGFSRGNFTMLDNLALGFSGTKEGMQQLLDKAEEISGFKYDISSYSDIVNAIHVVQQEMGITGTTAKEASDTIQGSFGSVQAAWQNLVTGMADKDADMGKLIGDVVGSAEQALNNMLPVVEQALSGLTQFINDVTPILMEKLPKILMDVAPKLFTAATTLAKSFVQNLSKALPELISMGIKGIQSLLTDFAKGIPDFIRNLSKTVLSLVKQLRDNVRPILRAAVSVLKAIVDGLLDTLPDLMAELPDILIDIVEEILDNTDEIITAGTKLFLALIEGLVKAIPKIVARIPDLISAIATAIGGGFLSIFKAGEELFGGLDTPAENARKKIAEHLSGMAEDIQKIKDIEPTVVDYNNMISGMGNTWGDVETSINDYNQKINFILTNAIQSRGKLNDADLANIASYNQHLQEKYAEQLELVRSAQTSLSRMIQMETLADLTPEHAQQFVVDAGARLDEANNMATEWYNAEIQRLENIYKAQDAINSDAHKADLKKTKEHYEELLAENQSYYDESMTQLNRKTKYMVSADEDAIAKLAVLNSAMAENTDLTSEQIAQMMDDLGFKYNTFEQNWEDVAADIDWTSATLYLSLLQQQQAKGKELTDGQKTFVDNMLMALSGLPTSTQEEMTSVYDGMVEVMGENVGTLHDAQKDGGDAIIGALRESFMIEGKASSTRLEDYKAAHMMKDMGKSMNDEVTQWTTAEQIKTWASGVDNIINSVGIQWGNNLAESMEGQFLNNLTQKGYLSDVFTGNIATLYGSPSTTVAQPIQKNIFGDSINGMSVQLSGREVGRILYNSRPWNGGR